MNAQLLETWAIHDRLNQLLLDAVTAETLEATTGKGRSVGEQFAHIHNVRLMWLKASAPALRDQLSPFEKGAPIATEALKKSLSASGSAIATLLEQSIANGGKVKNFKPHVTAFLGYLISHESHHRGQIALTLKLSGHPVDKKTLFGLWEWGTH
jgi:uncharacterized damage-inducible protein DinB